jgi:phage major head subunit gpT-like protein
MNLTQLRDKRAQVLREAEGLKGADGTFKDDATRAAFDAKMAEIETLDGQIREAETAEREQRLRAATVTDEQRAAIVAQERGRVTGINDAVRIAGLGAELAADMVTRGLTIDAARAEIFTELAARSAKNPTRTAIGIGEDARDKQQRGALHWLLVRSGMADAVAKAEGVERRTIDPGEFRGMSLVDLARHYLETAGRSVRGLDRMRIVGDALVLRDVTQSVSDFATLLENLLNKVLQAQYSITPDTWRRFCNTSTATDFRAQNRYRWGNLSSLDNLGQNGEFLQKALSDAEKATITVATKGNIVSISRQMIVNDDMNAFTRLPGMLGRAAALSIEVDIYALLASNAGLGPTLSDGATLFHATHGNITTGAALAAAAIDLDRVAMASQKEPNGNDYVDLRPAILVLPVGLGGQAKVINQSLYDPDTVANKSQMKPNIVVGLFREVVDTPRLSGTRRYLFADPSIAPVLEVAFLEGQQSPVLETQEVWRTDGAELKVRFDYGVAGVDYRGAVTNAGA